MAVKACDGVRGLSGFLGPRSRESYRLQCIVLKTISEKKKKKNTILCRAQDPAPKHS